MLYCSMSGCIISRIHINCGWFSSAKWINPRLFKRIYYEDCLVNNSKPKFAFWLHSLFSLPQHFPLPIYLRPSWPVLRWWLFLLFFFIGWDSRNRGNLRGLIRYRNMRLVIFIYHTIHFCFLVLLGCETVIDKWIYIQTLFSLSVKLFSIPIVVAGNGQNPQSQTVELAYWVMEPLRPLREITSEAIFEFEHG